MSKELMGNTNRLPCHHNEPTDVIEGKQSQPIHTGRNGSRVIAGRAVLPISLLIFHLGFVSLEYTLDLLMVQ
jgi:hypothetical protein